MEDSDRIHIQFAIRNYIRNAMFARSFGLDMSVLSKNFGLLSLKITINGHEEQDLNNR